MEDPFVNMVNTANTFNAFLQPSSASKHDRRSSIASNASTTIGDFAPHYYGTSPSASANSHQDGYAIPGLSSGGSSNPSLSPFSSPLSSRSLQASELAQLLSTGNTSNGTSDLKSLQHQQLSMHVPAGDFDTLLSNAGFTYPSMSQGQRQTIVPDSAEYLDGSSQFVDVNGQYAPMSASSSAFVSPEPSNLVWSSRAGMTNNGVAQATTASPSYASFELADARRASFAQSDSAASHMSDFSNMNMSRDFVAGVMTDDQTGWAAGSGMDIPCGMAGMSQQQHTFGDSSFGGPPNDLVDDISDEQLAAFVAGAPEFNNPTDLQYAGQTDILNIANALQIPSFNLMSDNSPRSSAASHSPFIFGQQSTSAHDHLAPPLHAGTQSSLMVRDPSRSASEHSDAEATGVSLAQVSGSRRSSVVKPNRRATQSVVAASMPTPQQLMAGASDSNKSQGLTERSTNLLSSNSSSPGDPSTNKSSPSGASRPPGRPRGKRDADNLHNIVEQRYRKNVKGSLDMLRDSVPRLRHLYKTSTPHQAATTDRDLGDGLIGGVRDLGKPTKKTVMEGARLYIVYLEREVGAQARRADLAEGFIRTNWPAGFAQWEAKAKDILNLKQAEADAYIDAEEKRLRTKYGLPSSGDEGADEQDEADESAEEEKPKKKKAKKSPPASDGKGSDTSAKPGRKGKRSAARDVVPKVGSVASSFAVAYTFFPKASKVFTSSTGASHAASRGSVLLSAPYQAASKSSALLSKALPEQAVPDPDIIMEWFWLIALASILTAVTWIVLERFVIGSSAEREVAAVAEERRRRSEIEQAIKDGAAGGDRLKKLLGIGGIGGVLRQAVSAGLAKVGFNSSNTSVDGLEVKAWDTFANVAVGGVTNLTSLARLQLSLFLARQTETDPQRLALRALLAAKGGDGSLLWQHAQRFATNSSDPALRRVLALPLDEAAGILRAVQPTDDPLGSIANHLVLVHLNDIISRIYITLIDASIPKPSAGEKTRVNSAQSIESLKRSTFTSEIQAVLTDTPRGSEGYALGLVIIAVWGLLAEQHVEMQRRVAYMLAVEELQGVAGKLSSVHAVLDLMAPGALDSAAGSRSATTTTKRSSPSAKEVDALALACIRWLGMLKALRQTKQDNQSPQQWLKVSSLELRVLLADRAFRRTFRGRGTKMLGFDPEDEESSTASVSSDEQGEGGQDLGAVNEVDMEIEAFDAATERLIDTLTVISRTGGQMSVSAAS